MGRSILLAIIWICIACIFWGLSYYHCKESKNEIPPIKWEAEGPLAGGINGLSTGVKETKIFAQGVSDYMVEYNKTTRRQNQIAAWGYFIAGLTSLFSMALGIKENNKFKKVKELKHHAMKFDEELRDEQII